MYYLIDGVFVEFEVLKMNEQLTVLLFTIHQGDNPGPRDHWKKKVNHVIYVYILIKCMFLCEHP